MRGLEGNRRRHKWEAVWMHAKQANLNTIPFPKRNNNFVLPIFLPSLLSSLCRLPIILTLSPFSVPLSCLISIMAEPPSGKGVRPVIRSQNSIVTNHLPNQSALALKKKKGKKKITLSMKLINSIQKNLYDLHSTDFSVLSLFSQYVISYFPCF